MGDKPKFVIRLQHESCSRDPENDYYSKNKPWQGVTKQKATRLSHKEARKQSDYLRSIRQGYRCVVEPLDGGVVQEKPGKPRELVLPPMESI